MEKYLNTIVIDGLEFKRLIKYEKIGDLYNYQTLTLTYGMSYSSFIPKLRIIPLYGIIKDDEYEELERMWKMFYKEYID